MVSAMPKINRAAKPASLTAAHWIAAAAAALAEGGIDAVRVEPLAARLRVTKGSFYWHFADRDALLAAVLLSWERETTLAVIERMETTLPDADARMRGLFRVASHNDRNRIEAAIRAWAQTGGQAAAAVRRVDARREAYVGKLLRALGLDPAAAKSRARLICLAVVGEIASSPFNPTRQPRDFWQDAYRQFTADLYTKA